MNKNGCVVVIPIHSPDPSAYELISFQQCFLVLKKHPIKVVAPMGLELAEYKKMVPQFDTIFINPRWQSSLKGYNKLKTSRFFYTIFKDYEYLLTYELDAFVFRYELEYWCGKGYDYIGAPWFEGFDVPVSKKLIRVGNSGFSLRKVKPIQKALRAMFYKDEWEYNSSKANLLKAYIKYPYRWFRNRFGENYTVQISGRNEDYIFGFALPAYDKNFQIAPIAEAVEFSFEVQPEILFDLNNHQLPMGCHAWWRYNLPFWKPFIEQFGYKL